MDVRVWVCMDMFEKREGVCMCEKVRERERENDDGVIFVV